MTTFFFTWAGVQSFRWKYFICHKIITSIFLQEEISATSGVIELIEIPVNECTP